MRLVVLAIDGRGMGHLNRCTELAKALKAVEPEAQVFFLAESPAAGLIGRAGFPFLKLPDPLHPLGQYALAGGRTALERDVLTAALARVQPEAVLLDFVVDRPLFEAVKRRHCKLILVLRRLRLSAMRELAQHPAMKLVDAFVVPHDADEFEAGEIPPGWQARCHFVGPVVKRLASEALPALRACYAGQAQHFVLVTAGGGGWAQAADLIRCAETALAQLIGGGLDVRALMVPGPLSRANPLSKTPGVEVVRSVADLPELMATADAVIASAGYNTVREVLGSGSPAVLVPLSDPGHDDQGARALEAQVAGRALVADLSAESIQACLQDILGGRGPAKRAPDAWRDSQTLGLALSALLSS